MYNEKTQQQGSAMKRDIAPRHRPMPDNVRSCMRDIPTLDMQSPSRRCNGTLRNSENGQMPQMPESPSTCTVGKCGGWGLAEHPLAMVYSPCQAWRDAYAPDVALSRGTLFSELDLPFEPAKCRKGCM